MKHFDFRLFPPFTTTTLKIPYRYLPASWLGQHSLVVSISVFATFGLQGMSICSLQRINSLFEAKSNRDAIILRDSIPTCVRYRCPGHG